MSIRYKSKEQLVFSVEGKPLGKGRNWGYGVKGKDAYEQIIKLGAKFAMAETKWTLTGEAVYMVIVVYTMPPSEMRSRKRKTKKTDPKKFEALVTSEPKINRITDVIVKALKGLVYKNPAQIAGLTVVKKFSTEPRVEILIGKPNDYKELAYDLRNA